MIYLLADEEWEFLEAQLLQAAVENAPLHMKIKRFVHRHKEDHCISTQEELALLIQGLKFIRKSDEYASESNRNRTKYPRNTPDDVFCNKGLYAKLVWLLKKQMKINNRSKVIDIKKEL